ncbi:MAG: alkylhydroperoxidase like protein AhpD family [Bacteroidetes bacterium]|jgi:AhpD family alkylhydroperoxidase|nr:alkylhydroperoxidase like protein AhpD family [Bacteroidota bacterium]
METRINIPETDPGALKAMLELDKYLQTTDLSNTHKELIKIRVSQINGCSYCINKHTKDARKYGETEQRIYLLSAWRETNLYTPEERAIFALTEEMTLISQGGVSKATYDQALELLGEKYLAQVMMAVITMNAWNRIGITTLMQATLDK